MYLLFQLIPKATRNFIKEGYMEKTGPKVSFFVSLICLFLPVALKFIKKKILYFKNHTCIYFLQHTEGFKKRWFSMDDRRLMYFKDPLVLHWL